MSHDTQRNDGGLALRIGSEPVRVAALAAGGVAAFAGLTLVLFFILQGPFGGANDLANGAVGWLTLALALVVHRATDRSTLGDAAVVAAALAALGLTWGSWLAISETTGYYLAGLVSTLGVAAVGAWLLLAHGASADTGVLVHRPSRLGRLAGAVMTVGVLALPGVLAGVDDQATAPWHALTSGAAWFGLYLLYPAWCAWLARCSWTSAGAGRRR